MDFEVIWSPSARLNLKEIVSYIAEDNAEIAQRFGLSLIDATKSFSSFPEKGRVVPEFGSQAIGEVIFKHYRIIYRVKKFEKPLKLSGSGKRFEELLNFKNMTHNKAGVSMSSDVASSEPRSRDPASLGDPLAL